MLDADPLRDWVNDLVLLDAILDPLGVEGALLFLFPWAGNWNKVKANRLPNGP